MNPEIKQRWLTALRSGEYKQGQEALCRLTDKSNPSDKSYCCLGVLVDLYVKDHGDVQWEYQDFNSVPAYGIKDEHGNTECSVLPSQVVAWAGVPDDNPNLIVLDDEGFPVNEDVMASLNDDYDMTFDKLADLIEEQL